MICVAGSPSAEANGAMQMNSPPPNTVPNAKNEIKRIRPRSRTLPKLKNFDPIMHKGVDEALVINSLLIEQVTGRAAQLFSKNPRLFVHVAQRATKNACFILREQSKYLAERNKEYRDRAAVRREDLKAKQQRWFEREKARIELEAMRRKQK